MIKLALTGSIGMGKTTVARMFEQAGIPVFDADAEVRRMQAPGGELVGEIARRFPGVVRDGAIDRDKLRHWVFEHRSDLAALEAIVHPAVRRLREAFIAAHRDADALLFEIPLLFETGGEADFDKTIVVSALPKIQRARVLGRDGMSPDKLDSILARQMPDAEKRSRADFVIDTSGDLSTTEAQVRDVLACLRLPSGR